MKRYLSMLLAAVLCASLLAACGGSGSSGQQPEEAEEAVSAEAAAQADTALADAQADADTTADDDAFYVYVKDAETMAPVTGATVQFCSDILCQSGRTDENGLAAFHADPGTYTVHFMKAPEGYAKSEEEFTLDKDTREATFLLNREETASESGTTSDASGSAASVSELDFPSTGFTFTPPEEFKELSGQITFQDYGEIEPGAGVTAGYIAYQAKNEAELQEYLKSLGINSIDEVTGETMSQIDAFYADTPNLALFRVVGVSGDQDLEQLKKKMFSSPILVFDEIGTAGDYTFYYIALDDAEYFDNLRGTAYPQDRLEEAYQLWQEAAAGNFKDRITVKEPVSPFSTAGEGSSVSFETQDLDGNPVTSEELFAGHKITMINVWATWCINCKTEMEALEAMKKEWAYQDCQIIGICDDAVDDETIAEAKKILEEHGVTYRNVRMTEEIFEQIGSAALPTSYFMDSNGTLLTAPITGKHEDQYSETLQELLSGME